LIPDWEIERREMVEVQMRRRGIQDARLLRALEEIPREEFVPPDARLLAYGTTPSPSGAGKPSRSPI